MSTVQSELTEAQAFATGLALPSQDLAAAAHSEQDSQTTVAGNGNAHNGIAFARSSAASVVDAITSSVANIGSVAEEFQALDQETAALISGGQQ